MFSPWLGSCATLRSSLSPDYVLSCVISNHGGPAFLESMKILSMSPLRSLTHAHLHLPFMHCFTPLPSRTSRRVRQAFTQWLYHFSPWQRQKHNNYFLWHSLYCTCHSLFASHIYLCIFPHSFSIFPPFLLSFSWDFFPYSDDTLF